MLREAGIPHDDATYTGDDGSSALSLQYYRDKAREFQSIMNGIDQVARAAEEALELGIDEDTRAALLADLADFDARKWTFRATAEAINAGAALINALGGRFPRLSTPAGLAALPAIVVTPAMIAAIGTAAALITWGLSWIAGVNERLRQAQLLTLAPAEVKAELSRILGRAEAAQVAAAETPLASIAGVVKWGAIGLAAWLAWRAWNDSRA